LLQAHALEEGREQCGVAVHRDRQDHDVVALGEALGEAVELRPLADAGLAPGRPEVDDDELAGEVGERDGLAGEVLDGELRGGALGARAGRVGGELVARLRLERATRGLALRAQGGQERGGEHEHEQAADRDKAEVGEDAEAGDACDLLDLRGRRVCGFVGEPWHVRGQASLRRRP
jgi:hypothetical protein